MQILRLLERRRGVVAPRGSLTCLAPLAQRVLESAPWYASPHIDELEQAVRATAADLRDRGSLPEHVVIALKHATARGIRRRFTEDEDELHYRIVLWSVREYFHSEW
jgi:hypothetical protein